MEQYLSRDPSASSLVNLLALPNTGSGATLTLPSEPTERVPHNLRKGSLSPPPAHLSGSDGKPRRRLLKRSHHTINTVAGESE